MVKIERAAQFRTEYLVPDRYLVDPEQQSGLLTDITVYYIYVDPKGEVLEILVECHDKQSLNTTVEEIARNSLNPLHLINKAIKKGQVGRISMGDFRAKQRHLLSVEYRSLVV